MSTDPRAAHVANIGPEPPALVPHRMSSKLWHVALVDAINGTRWMGAMSPYCTTREEAEMHLHRIRETGVHVRLVFEFFYREYED